MSSPALALAALVACIPIQHNGVAGCWLPRAEFDRRVELLDAYRSRRVVADRLIGELRLIDRSWARTSSISLSLLAEATRDREQYRSQWLDTLDALERSEASRVGPVILLLSAAALAAGAFAVGFLARSGGSPSVILAQ